MSPQEILAQIIGLYQTGQVSQADMRQAQSEYDLEMAQIGARSSATAGLMKVAAFGVAAYLLTHLARRA